MVPVWWPPSLRNRKVENYREINHNLGAFIKFHEAKQLLYNQSTNKYFTLLQFSFLLKEWIKRSVNIFYLRLCHLLEGPKRLIRTEGIEPEIQSKTLYRGEASNLEHNGALECAPESLPNLEWCLSSMLRNILMKS